MSQVSKSLQGTIRENAGNRCGYRLLPQSVNPAYLEIEHILPKAKGGNDEENNLWLACRLCNGHKATQTDGFDSKTKKRVKLFNPRHQNWKRHFKFDETKTMIIGKTACGRATIEALRMNNDLIVPLRKLWISFDKFPPEGY